MADFMKVDKTDNQPTNLTEQELFADMRAQLKFTLAGWHRVTNHGTGASAFFPSVPNVQNEPEKQQALEAAWEQRSIIMHSRQYRIRLDPKPEAKSRLDQSQHQHQPRPETRPSKIRGTRLAPVNEHGTSGEDSLPQHHRTGHGTIGMGIVRV